MTVKILGEERANPESIEKAKCYKSRIEKEFSCLSNKFWEFWKEVEKDFPESWVPGRGKVDVLICVPTAVNVCSPEAIQFALRSLKD